MDTVKEDFENVEAKSYEYEEKQEKTDIKKLLAVVPPPSAILSKNRKVVKEKRIRLVYDSSIGKDEAKIPSGLAKELGVKDFIEISIAGRKRFRFRALIADDVSGDVVHVNPELMKIHGVADKSICTIRST
ncbi:MAG: hypothetical protein QW101_03340 [Ignisphaera sp.]|uniref:30S ribosomal protein S6e n=1 Tax=Ignisphaera aggregans TaxID=334771 RepID=A0A7J3MWL8_9CREN